MAEYKRIKKAKTVLALCFARGKETYHHWRVFSSGADGVCIEFDEKKIIQMFNHESKIIAKEIDYKYINDLENKGVINADELPFLTRKPYEDEKEYRVVYLDEDDLDETMDYKIELEWIVRMTLSPWMPKVIAQSVSKLLKSIDGAGNIRIAHSSLTSNDDWQRLTELVV